ncbi:MAG: phosphate/phosphite/phosphonate ABC transporter substrate-binding protein [Chloroflexi bacterium]|uniref:Phosphate/phosphite/phosphonate ABC transporter substrate-binding protein n=1 Tax=Candidatus Chlorohelix allophototropha TaxID=3003348 RepID=A0A8T7M539_9CHLR|nr:phosphate/phosphite/phosphonate ABC transporter substrate-binding protein [Chloroflexota bacterium]WJW69129.1 phosphate/phosphite/phosphonate ABC transporter substrate-binding protein [Chloroflexota bacterium L227-S17]
MIKSEDGKERLVLAINPVIGHNLVSQADKIKTLEQYLEQVLEIPVQVGLWENYEETLNGMERGEIDAARLGLYAFAQAQARFGARALANAIEVSAGDNAPPVPYRSVIFTRKDTGIVGLIQLKGQEFGFVDRNSSTGYLVPSLMLDQAGLKPATDLKPHFLLGHNTVVEAVCQGKLFAGATMQSAYLHHLQEHPTCSLQLLATSPLLSRGPVAVRPGLPPRLEHKLLQALVQLDQRVPEAASLLIPTNQRFTPAAQREMTLKTVAELAGVSYGTVSRAINGRARIAPDTTARILKLVEELGYRPNSNARNLHQNRGDLIGLLIPTLQIPALDEIVAGIQAVFSEVGLQLVVCPAVLNGMAGESRKAFFELLYNNRLEGMIMTQYDAATREAGELARSGRPYALLEQDLLGEGLITARNWIEVQGHHRIALVQEQGSLLEAGFMRQVFARQAAPELEFTEEINTISSWLETILQKPEPPTLIFCSGDRTALSVQKTLLAQLSIDLSVLGFGNSDLAKWGGFPSLAFHGVGLGRLVALRLLKMLNMPSLTLSEPPLRTWIEVHH